MKNFKLVRLVLLAVIAVSCLILIIPSATMLKNYSLKGEIKYENVTGDLVAYLMKSKADGTKTYRDMISSMSRFQVIVLLVNVVAACVLILGEFKDKCFPLCWLLLLIASIFEINIMGSSGLYKLLSFLPPILSVVYKVLGGNRKKKGASAEK